MHYYPEMSTVEFNKTDHYKKIEKNLSLGKWLKNLREATGYSQSELGKLIGGSSIIGPARISDWESDFRPISKAIAKKLAAFFNVPVEKFI